MPETQWGKELAAAYVAMQAELREVPKLHTAKIQTPKANYQYTYANLTDTIAAIRPLLAKHGLAVAQEVRSESHVVGVLTTIVHVSGQSVTFGPLNFPGDSNPQGIGTSITYARRYALTAALGIATEDDDAQSASKAAPPERTTRTKPPGKPAESAAQAVGLYERMKAMSAAQKEAFKQIKADSTHPDRTVTVTALEDDTWRKSVGVMVDLAVSTNPT